MASGRHSSHVYRTLFSFIHHAESAPDPAPAPALDPAADPDTSVRQADVDELAVQVDRLDGNVRQLTRALLRSRAKLHREQELRHTLQRQLREERDEHSPRSLLGHYAGLGAPLATEALDDIHRLVGVSLELNHQLRCWHRARSDAHPSPGHRAGAPLLEDLGASLLQILQRLHGISHRGLKRARGDSDVERQ